LEKHLEACLPSGCEFPSGCGISLVCPLPLIKLTDGFNVLNPSESNALAEITQTLMIVLVHISFSVINRTPANLQQRGKPYFQTAAGV
jgi:hypothetical protein